MGEVLKAASRFVYVEGGGGAGVWECSGLSTGPPDRFWHVISEGGRELCVYGDRAEAWLVYDTVTAQEMVDAGKLGVRDLANLLKQVIDVFPVGDLTDVPVADGGLSVATEEDQGALVRADEIVDAIFEDGGN